MSLKELRIKRHGWRQKRLTQQQQYERMRRIEAGVRFGSARWRQMKGGQ